MCHAFQAPNGLGTLLGVAQLILYATFYKSTQREMAARQSKGEMGLAEIAPLPSDSKVLNNNNINQILTK